MLSLDLNWERVWWQKGFKSVVGVDEAGRGAMAGPVVAAAVSFCKEHKRIPGINDSKKLIAKRRSELALLIKAQAVYWSAVFVPPPIIDALGIAQATYTAMYRAVEGAGKADYVIIDGNIYPKIFKKKHIKGEAVIRGDQLIYSVACASIIAKTERDKLMCQLAGSYPKYIWQHNKGYGTLFHRQQMVLWGLSPIHRKSFSFTL